MLALLNISKVNYFCSLSAGPRHNSNLYFRKVAEFDLRKRGRFEDHDRILRTDGQADIQERCGALPHQVWLRP